MYKIFSSERCLQPDSKEIFVVLELHDLTIDELEITGATERNQED